MILTVTTRISRKWLERKSKAELASIILANIDKIDLFADESTLKCEIERETARRCAEIADDMDYLGGIADAIKREFGLEERG